MTGGPGDAVRTPAADGAGGGPAAGSTAAGSTAAGSTAAGSPAAGSPAAGSPAAGSTAAGGQAAGGAAPGGRGEPRLRMMTAGDLDAVLDFEYALFGEEAWSREMLAGELSQQPASRHYLVAEEAGIMAGYAGLLAAGEQADVLTIAVSASRWGHGIGSVLLAALIAEARRRGCREMFLEVRSDNVRAQRLYQWWGFAEIGIRRGYYQPSGTDAVVMRRDLATVSEAELALPARPAQGPEAGDA
jgi:ribosomal-protein-alanine N-acetyltransferase